MQLVPMLQIGKNLTPSSSHRPHMYACYDPPITYTINKEKTVKHLRDRKVIRANVFKHSNEVVADDNKIW